MMRMGPEALLVRSSVDARIDLADFARQEFCDEDPRVLERRVRTELDHERAAWDAPLGLMGRARAWFGRGRAAREAAARTSLDAAARRAEAKPFDDVLIGRPLAGMPACLAPIRPER